MNGLWKPKQALIKIVEPIAPGLTGLSCSVHRTGWTSTFFCGQWLPCTCSSAIGLLWYMFIFTKHDHKNTCQNAIINFTYYLFKFICQDRNIYFSYLSTKKRANWVRVSILCIYRSFFLVPTPYSEWICVFFLLFPLWSLCLYHKNADWLWTITLSCYHLQIISRSKKMALELESCNHWEWNDWAFK